MGSISRGGRSMRAFARPFKAAVLVAALAAPAGAAPERIVSINLCTDLLLMLLADPEQIASVSFLASEPQSSAMVAESVAYPANYGRAEEVFLMDPDLVPAGWPIRPRMWIRLRTGFARWAP